MFPRFLSLFLMLFWSLSALAVESHVGRLRFGLFNEMSDNKNATSRIFELRSRFEYESMINNYIDTELAIEALMQNGSITFEFQERPGPRQGLRVRGAAIKIHDPAEYSQLALGVFDPNETVKWPYWKPLSFPGLQAQGSFEIKNFGLRAQALQTIAASTVSSREVNEHDQNPRLTMESLDLYYHTRTFQADLQTFHFRFFDLPSQVAHFSRFDGNTVIGNNPQLTEYFYEFDGFGTSLSLSQYITPTWKMGVRSAYMENLKAPSGINKGFENSIESSFRFYTDYEISPAAGFYKKGSDVFPAYYLNNIQSMTNIDGEFVRLTIQPIKKDWGLQMFYVNGRAIRKTPYQDQLQVVKLNWIQSYDLF